MTCLEEPVVDTPFVLGMMRLIDSPEYRQPVKLAGWIEQQLELGLRWPGDVVFHRLRCLCWGR